jgi:ATP-dependent Clp protease protease subunit
MEKHKIISKKSKIRTSKKKEDLENEECEEENLTDLVTCEENHIYFYDYVNTKSILTLIRHIKNLNTKFVLLKNELDTKYHVDIDIYLYLHINSSGGYITDAFAALDYIKKSQIPIISIVEGFAASAATFLSIVCYKRQITSFSSMLIHQLSSVTSGTFEQLEDDHENNMYLEDCIKKLYVTYTHGKLNNKLLEKILKRDLMWNASKCLQHGLVDEII